MSNDPTSSRPDDVSVADSDLDETPAVAGGHDDAEPEQGEGEANSY